MNLQKIEDSNFPIKDIINLVLVGAGVKPTAQVIYKGKTYSRADDIYIISKKERKILMQTVREFNIPFVFEKKHIMKAPPISNELIAHIKKISLQTDEGKIRELLGSIKNTEIIRFYFGKDIELAEKLQNTNSNYKAGILLGYPKTAVKNSVENGAESNIHIPKELRPFSYFTLSKKHEQEELKILRLWHSTVKKLSPRLYAELSNR